MTTSASHSSWPLDVLIDGAKAGLRAPSKVRMKIFTLDNRLILKRAGNLQESDRRAVAQALIGLSAE
jgi:mRNA interferase MazF